MEAERKPRYRQPRTLSCLPCRERKLKCDRRLPCQNCVRYKRETTCLKHPSPATFSVAKASGTSKNKSKLAESSRRELIQKPLSPSNSDVSYEESLSASRSTDAPVGSTSHDQTALNDARRIRTATSRSIGDLHLMNHAEDIRAQNQENTLKIVSDIEPSYLPSLLTPAAPQTLASGNTRPFPGDDTPALLDPASYWRWYLSNLLPSQTQCDFLVSYYIENLNWVYHALHIPSFRRQYAEFWTKDVAEIDLIWLSLLYIILSLSALYIPDQTSVAMGFESGKIRDLCHTWYSASRQALHAGDFDSKPSLYQIQTFLLSQLYWYATKKVETLNSYLGMTIRNAQALGLDRETYTTNCLERELRYRLWWDLVSSDTFQSLCLGRAAFLQSHLSEIPFPSNCNDFDVTEDSITVHPIEEPTEMSMHVFRARVFKTFNKLYINNGAGLSSYEYVASIDDEIMAITNEYPWYFPPPDCETDPQLPSTFNFIPWGYHILNSCICVQRIRMYRPFLHPRIQDSWSRCIRAANEALAVYRRIRAASPTHLRFDQKAQVQNYQTFSTAITLAILLLVERPSESEAIRADIEMVIADLEPLDGVDIKVPMVVEGRKALRKILSMFDQRDRTNAAEPTALVPAVYTVIGGENTARKYLERCAIEYIINNEHNSGRAASGGLSTANWTVGMGGGELPPNTMDMLNTGYSPRNFEWDFLLDMSNWAQWDTLWPELNVVQ